MTLEEILTKNEGIVFWQDGNLMMPHVATAINIISKEGINLEFGVYSGSTINYLSSVFKSKKFYGFDSFEGLPEDWVTINGHFMNKGYFNLNGKMPKVNENVTLIKGWFEDTLPNFINEIKEQVAFINIDCDLYSSTVTVLENCKDLIKKDTLIYFDEFHGYEGYENGEFKAWNEFIKKYNIDFHVICFSPTQILFKIK